MPISDYSEAELQPRNLTPEEIADPEQFISELFSFAHLPQWREILWQSLRLIVVGDWKNLSIKEKSTFIATYEKIAKLIEIAHLIHRKTAP